MSAAPRVTPVASPAVAPASASTSGHGAQATPPAVAAPAIHIDRLVVDAPGSLADGNRIAQRLPAALHAAVAREGMPADERVLRALVDRTVREALR